MDNRIVVQLIIFINMMDFVFLEKALYSQNYELFLVLEHIDFFKLIDK